MKTMNQKKMMWERKGLGSLLAFACSLLILGPVYASDTEVYARQATATAATAPVLMMVLDTSSNMLRCMNSTSTANCADTTNTRVAVMTRVMHKALIGSPTSPIIKPPPGYLHMGYSRFNPNNNQGGWVRYPANLTLDDIVYNSLNTFTNVTVNYNVPNSASDTDTSASGLSANTFILGNNKPDVGVRFANVLVPMGATISSATLTFVPSTSNPSTAPTITVAGEPVDNAPVFASGNDLNSREGSGSFSTPASYSATSSAVTIGVTSQVQAIVNRSGWCGGQALALFIKNGGGGPATQQGIYSADNNSSAAPPKLSITFSLPAGSMTNTCYMQPIDTVVAISNGYDDVEYAETGATGMFYDQKDLQPAAITSGVRNIVGVRFANVGVQRNATITNAWLYSSGLTQAGVTGPATTVTVDGYATGNLPTFCTRNSSTQAVTCNLPTASGTTSSSSLALPTATLDTNNFVADVTNVVQELVNQGSWSSGNALGFRLYNSSTSSSSNSLVSLASVDGGSSRGMVLHIKSSQRFTDLTHIPNTVRQDMLDDMDLILNNNLGAQASLGSTYAEAARYMLGEVPYSVDTNIPLSTYTFQQPDPTTYTVNASGGLVYRSPIDATSCAANYIYMMSDGIPDNASGVQNNSQGGPMYNTNYACSNYVTKTSGNSNKNLSCMMGVAQALATAKNPEGKTVRTNTVLFGPIPASTDASFTDYSNLKSDLSQVSTYYGAGKYYDATDETTLLSSLQDTLTALVDISGSITAPGVAVNQFSRLTHLDQLYYAVFDPDPGHARWLGNVKRYRLAFISTGSTDTAQIVDALGYNAIDPQTSFFSATAKSYWTPSTAAADGNNVAMGGAASVLPAPDSRTGGNGPRIIYTNPVSGSNTLYRISSDTTQPGMSSAVTVTGLTSTQFSNLAKWMLGYKIIITDNSGAILTSAVTADTTTPVRYQLGGVLHSQPLLVNFGYTGSDPTAAASDTSLQDNMVFFGDMEGMLHAVNANTGVELFAFMPKETLVREPVIAANNLQSLPEFGMDLTLAVLREDGNGDLKITTSGSDKVYLFAGQRMGGRNLYALDVTNRSAPTLKWQITGGSTGAFANLGQTWSKPVVGKIKINGVAKTVLFMGGGYDAKHETAGYASPTNDSDSLGNQIYILDPDTGNVLWWASNTASASLNVSAMKFSIPSELKTFDSNSDGLVDALYFGDLGGQVFRMDINNNVTGNSAPSVTRVTRIANLGQLSSSASTSTQRRFYEVPSVAPMLDPNTNQPYAAIALGSGYRSHPLNTGTSDAFYMLRDDDAMRADLQTTTSLRISTPITHEELPTVLYNASTGATLTSTSRGWKMMLPGIGEKVLSAPLIVFGDVFFTSYVPDASAASSCTAVTGSTTLWRMHALDGSITDTNGDGVVDGSDRRYQTNVVQGLGGSPELIVGQGGRNAILTGTGAVRNRDFGAATARRIRWYQKKN